MTRAWLLALVGALLLHACNDDTDYQDGGNNGSNNAAQNNSQDNNANNGGENSAQNSADNSGLNNNSDPNNADNNADNNVNNPDNNVDNNGNNPNNGDPDVDGPDMDPDDDTGPDPDVPDEEYSPTVGGDCESDADCSVNEYCVGADARSETLGYCTVLDCASNADCAFPRGGTFCCSSFGGTRGCFQEPEGASCGDEGGQQNDNCAEGGQSDCAGDENFYCVEFYDRDSALCAGECDPDDASSCPEGSYCFETQRNFGICLPFGETPERESCLDDPWSCGEGAYCAQQYEGDPYRYCASLCANDDECGANQWCQRYPGQQLGTCQDSDGTLQEGQSCTEDRFGCAEGLFCLYEGTRYAQCVSLCRRDSDCDGEGDYVCDYYDAVNQRGICTSTEAREDGAPCGDDPLGCGPDAFCVGGYENAYNPDAYCAQDCTADPRACGEGFVCEVFGEVAYCQPDGPVGPRGECERPTDCAQGSYCVQGEDGSSTCTPRCDDDAQCEAGEYCAGAEGGFGVCYPFGDVEDGASCVGREQECRAGSFCAGPEPVCIPECTDAPDGCPDGMVCLDANAEGRRFCYPHGDVPAYGACEGVYDCEPDSYCDTRNGQGVCLPTDCQGDDDCAADHWCFRGPNWSQCVPEGEGMTGDDCAEDGFACAEGHFCLYGETEQAYCAQDCTGFPDVCREGEVCRYFGSGYNLCVAPGETPPGASCAQDAQACDAGSICVGVGEPEAYCAQLCTFDADACADGTSCFFTAGGLGVCLPEGATLEDPFNEGGGPL